jgi:hypothetical protein
MIHHKNGERGGVNMRSAALRLIASAVVIALAGIAGGCDSRNDVEEAIEKAGTQIYALSGGSAVDGVPVKAREKVFGDAIQTLGDVADKGTPTQQASVSLLLARSYAGQGEIAAANAADLEARFVSDLSVLRAHLNQWTSQNGVADALVVYDPTKDLQAIAEQVKARNDEMAGVEGKKASETQRIAAIKAEADRLIEQAKADRAAEAAMRAQGDGASQVRKLELLQQAAEKRRAADQLEQQASVKMAEYAREAPLLEELDRVASRNRTQIDLLAKAKTDVNSRVETNKRLSKAARDESAKAADLIKKGLGELEAARTAANGPTQQAVQAYTKAVTSAKKAANGAKDARVSSQLSAASYALALGDVHATKARSLNAYAISLDLLATARPALPDAAVIKSAAASVNQELSTALEEAKKAYKDAQTLYSGAGGKSPEDKKLGDLINERLGKLMGEAPAPAAAPENAPPANDAGAPAAADPAAAPAPDAPKPPPGG